MSRKILIEVTPEEYGLINEGGLEKAAEKKWDKIKNISDKDLITELIRRKVGKLAYKTDRGTIVRHGSFNIGPHVEVQLTLTLRKGYEND